MTLLSGNIPESWIIAFCIAVATTIFTVIGGVLLLLDKRPTKNERAQLYQMHERMTHIAESPSIPDRRAA